MHLFIIFSKTNNTNSYQSTNHFVFNWVIMLPSVKFRTRNNKILNFQIFKFERYIFQVRSDCGWIILWQINYIRIWNSKNLSQHGQEFEELLISRGCISRLVRDKYFVHAWIYKCQDEKCDDTKILKVSRRFCFQKLFEDFVSKL